MTDDRERMIDWIEQHMSREQMLGWLRHYESLPPYLPAYMGLTRQEVADEIAALRAALDR